MYVFISGHLLRIIHVHSYKVKAKINETILLIFFWNVEVTTPRLINVTCCEKSPFGFEPRATGIPCRIYNQRAIKNRYIDWESCIG